VQGSVRDTVVIGTIPCRIVLDTCGQCGTHVDDHHVVQPNIGTGGNMGRRINPEESESSG
jgi:hypothetical protein